MAENASERFEQILDEALDLPASERAAYLDEACAGDAELRARVEAMVAGAEAPAPSKFLDERPNVSPEILKAYLPDDTEETQPHVLDMMGRQIGGFRVVEQIGKGGMGMVYRAERTGVAFDKTVAVKVVRPGMYTTGGVERFEYERRILARLEHPNIAHLIDGGETEDGLPYFIMEYVEGQPLDEYCNTNRLTIRERLKLFKTVCEAVRYAHRNLVVHRDLKPSNILVTKEGAVKLLDFGIAKIREPDEEETIYQTGQNMQPMTMAYAAPEQVLGKTMNAATDVYALGVILYQLLTGHRPYALDAGKIVENIDRVRFQVPALPSQIATQALDRNGITVTPEALGAERRSEPRRIKSMLTGDLDAVVMMALKKEPAGRYPTAAELLADINAFLERRPVKAQRDTNRYRAYKFIQRHKMSVAAFSLFALALIAGTVISISMAQTIAEEKNQKEEEARRAQLSLDYLLNIFAAVDPDEVGQDTLTAVDLLNRGYENLRDLDEEPAIEASLLNMMGWIYVNMGEYPKADSLYTLAGALILDDDAASLELARSKYGRGLTNYSLAKYTLAEEQLREAIAILTQEDEGVLLVEAQNQLSAVLVDLGNYTEASNWAEAAINDAKKLLGSDPEEVALLLGTSYTRLATASHYQLRYADADSLYRIALTLRQEWLDASHPKIGNTVYQLGNNLLKLERVEEAEEQYLRALRIYEGGYGRTHPAVASAKIALANFFLRTKQDVVVALKYALEADSAYVARFDTTYAARVYSLSALGELYLLTEQFGEARSALQQGISIYEQTGGEVGPLYAIWLYYNYGMVALRQGADNEAEEWLHRTVRMVIDGKLALQYERAQKALDRLYEMAADDRLVMPASALHACREALNTLESSTP